MTVEEAAERLYEAACDADAALGALADLGAVTDVHRRLRVALGDYDRVRSPRLEPSDLVETEEQKSRRGADA